MRRSKWIVITTINPPTSAVRRLARWVGCGWAVVVVGDKKTPTNWQVDGVTYLSPGEQKRLFPDLADLLLYGHYARKNLGYLYAMAQGARVIIDTDDDNAPYDDFGRELKATVTADLLVGPGWINIYSHFSRQARLWPRGLPLDAIRARGRIVATRRRLRCPVQQYLANGDPDVDAIYRLTVGRNVRFLRRSRPLALDHGTWSPFNSQNTVFFAAAFPLLYLPSHVSFRMTDIWRSLVAQVCLHHGGEFVSFHAATVWQERNPHDLMKDFELETSGYLRNREIMESLRRAILKVAPNADTGTRAAALWREMVRIGAVPSREMKLFAAWRDVLQRCLQDPMESLP